MFLENTKFVNLIPKDKDAVAVYPPLERKTVSVTPLVTSHLLHRGLRNNIQPITVCTYINDFHPLTCVIFIFL